VDEAYDGLGISYDFFRTVFGWDFHAHYGTPMRAVVHYGESYNNMFWDGTQFIYGDGDGELFYRFTRSLEVTGHEVALGAVQSRLQLPFRNQPGALLHSLADVFGVLVRQYHLDQSVDQADWLVGDGLFVPRPGVHALRSISQPGTGYQGDQVLGDDPQPDHMSRYVRTEQDQGGVHINSGIPNRAFYLAAVAIGGKAWEGAGAIWWQALADSELNARSGFRAFAGATVRAAGTHVDAVADAWRQVGVRLAGRSAA
jgi:Zn-dependent metalloprotease